MFGCVETPKGLNKAIIVHTSIGCDPRTMHRRAGHCRAHRVAEVIENWPPVHSKSIKAFVVSAGAVIAPAAGMKWLVFVHICDCSYLDDRRWTKRGDRSDRLER